MARSIHPLEATERLRQDYTRYLQTTFFLRDEVLRQQFQTALAQTDFLVRGPLLEASPPFRNGRSIAHLIKEGVLHRDFDLLTPSLPPRELYLHQERAIEQVVRHRRNIVVATGTGSGKTESFLIPILDSLLRERAAGRLTPGVRALLLYPMNALANDQLKRLRGLLGHFPAITFGRYTGETRETEREAVAQFREQFQAEPPPNEYISRERMREEPPHLLITNYAMLEYLLLRPEDSEFFDGPMGRFWRFLVLDEAHIYDGATGIEIAMLLRRLKDRVVGGERGRLTCIATSATLGKGANLLPAIATFAETLFDEPFTAQDIIEGEREPLAQAGPPWGEGSLVFYRALEAALHSQAALTHLRAVCQTANIPAEVISEALDQRQQVGDESDTKNHFLHTLLRGDARLHRLREELQEPRRLTELARRWGEDTEAEDTIIALVSLAVRARLTPDSLSLLPARYHLFARALEGAFLCLNEAHSVHQGQAQPRLFLHRHERCPHCEMAVFELATCPRCGIGYLVGREESRHHHTLLRHLTGWGEEAAANLCYLLLGEATEEADEDESLGERGTTEETGLDSLDTCELCLGCGAMDSRCDCPPGTPKVILPRLTPTKSRQGLQRCAACGTRSHPISRFLTGRDAPVSVLATSLYQLLPPANDQASAELSGGGRKLLAFADSRQDAAFFAPYLENTYSKILQRRLIAQVLLAEAEKQQEAGRLQDLVDPLRRAAEAAGLFSLEEGGRERKKTVTLWLMRELTALDARIGLEGLGFLRFRLVKPPAWEPPPPLLAEPWHLTPDEAWAMVELLLTTLRQQAIITFPDDVPSDDPIFAPRLGDFYVCDVSAKGKPRVMGWLPKQGSNRRLDFLLRVLRRFQPTWGEADIRQHAHTVLKGLWAHLLRPLWRMHLPPEQPKGLGVVYRLNHKLWEWVPVRQMDDPIYRCNRCFAVSYHSLRGICPTNGCDGTLLALTTAGQAWVDHHYRQLYQTLDPYPLTAEEHTAQWTASEASSIQSRFIRGEVNVLSCSTTFELGVDVGDLQAVLLRNMPPTTANYLQRAGRAGRRTDSVAFVLTFAQRRSHDLTYYAQPERMVAGHVPPPVLTIHNEKIARRHVHAVALAAFFRWIKERDGRRFGTVGSFFAPPQGLASGLILLQEYLQLPNPALRATLRRLVPPVLQEEIGIETDAWHAGLLNEAGDGVMDKASAEVCQDLELYARLENEAREGSKYKQAEYFQRVAETVRGRNLLGFLGSRNVLPKYGFPTDVVELRTGHIPDKRAQQVELQRDLQMAISEYAPDGEIVAAKQVWKSRGLYQMAGRTWETIAYAICPNCHRFHRSKDTLPSGACEGCGEGLAQSKMRGKFVIPEFGFVADRDVTPSGERRPQRLYASQIYFSDYQGSPPPWTTITGLGNSFIKVSERHARYGRLSLVNSGFNGAGFQICTDCGWARAVRSNDRGAIPKHNNPRTAHICKTGKREVYHLGHEFLTDVIELRFDGLRLFPNERAGWLSALYALLEGASEILGVARDEVEGTLHRSHQAFSLVLFDKVPGGAGYVVRLQNASILRAALEAGRQRVARCECGEETSCYECLRTFYNQHAHDLLRRNLALHFFNEVLGEEH